MKILKFVFLFCYILIPDIVFSKCPYSSGQAFDMMPPVAIKEEKIISNHGDDFIDNYFYLRFSETDPRVFQYIDAEQKYMECFKKKLVGYKKQVQKEIDKIQDSQKILKNETEYMGSIYYKINEKSKQYPIFMRASSADRSSTEVLIDPNLLVLKYKFEDFVIFQMRFSPDHTKLALAVATTKTSVASVLVYDLLKKDIIFQDEEMKTLSSLTWAINSAEPSIIYFREIVENQHYQLVKANILSSKIEILLDGLTTSSLHIQLSPSKMFYYVSESTGGPSTENAVYVSAANLEEGFNEILPRKSGRRFRVSDNGDKHYIFVNEADVSSVYESEFEDIESFSDWKLLFDTRNKDFELQNMLGFKEYLIFDIRKEGNSQGLVYRFANKSLEFLDLGLGNSVFAASISPAANQNNDFISKNPYFEQSYINYTFESMIHGKQLVRLDLDTKKYNFQEDPIANNYRQSRKFAKGRDGTMIPYDMARKVDTPLNENTPILLYGYGAYGVSIEPWNYPDLMAMMNLGFVVVRARPRGGRMYGSSWYEEGRLLKKRNTFYDMISVAEDLIDNKYTSKKNIYLYGRSAGGLLVGATVNERPDLFRGAIADLPFVDVLNTMLDPSLPLTIPEYGEWGNPTQNVADYFYIKSYSPYNNIEAKHYPAMLYTGGIHDDAVTYWEPLKMVAKLRATKTDKNLLLLDLDRNEGHRGRKYADIYSFFLYLERNPEDR